MGYRYHHNLEEMQSRSQPLWRKKLSAIAWVMIAALMCVAYLRALIDAVLWVIS